MFFIKKNIKALLLSLSLVIALLLFIFWFQRRDESNSYSDTFIAMDTVVSVSVSDDLCGDVKDTFTELDTILDCHSENSSVYALNRDGSIENAPLSLVNIVGESIALSDEYGSDVDISAGRLIQLWNDALSENKLPDENEINSIAKAIGYKGIDITNDSIKINDGTSLDFGSVAKGYALDIIKSELDEKNTDYAVISTGSSVLLYGKKPDGDKFNVVITNPDNPDDVLGNVKADETFLSTSGGYERFYNVDNKNYCHIIDLDTNMPSTSDLTSVTVFCDSGIKSDFLSTLIFIGGTKCLDRYLNANDYKIIAADKNKNIYVSNGLDFTVNINSGFTLAKK